MPAQQAISWSFILLAILCAGVLAAGFFFAAKQHFTSMEFGLKNSKLRDQIQNLETEKRRLLLAREVALSPLAIRKAARGIGLYQNEPGAAVPVVAKTNVEKTDITAVKVSRSETNDSVKPAQTVMRTVLSDPIHQKPTVETRPRVVDSSKEKKDKTEVAALLKLR